MTATVEAPIRVPEVPIPERPSSPPSAVRGRRLVVVGAGVLLLALLLGALPRVFRREQLAAEVATVAAVPMVRVAAAVAATSVPTVNLPATLAAIETAPIYARAPGYVGRLLVDIGARVRRGDVLARIDAPELDFQVEQARATVAQNHASLILAQTELTRWRSLSADSAVTADELDQKEAAFNVATAALNNAQASLRQLEQLQRYENVSAPFAGVITARNVDAGALVGVAGAVSGSLPSGAGSPLGSLFQLDRVDTLRAYVTVPEDYASAVQVGQPAVVAVPSLPGDTLRGVVVRTANALDPEARTLVTEVDVANPTGAFLPGAYAQVRLTLGRRKMALQVPAVALIIRDGPPQVMTVGADSVVHFATVGIGRDYGDWVEVTDGVAVGASIVLNPPDNLKEGDKVRVAKGEK